MYKLFFFSFLIFFNELKKYSLEKRKERKNTNKQTNKQKSNMSLGRSLNFEMASGKY